MRALQILSSTSTPTPTLCDDHPTPSATDTHLLIRVHAAGITHDELHWPETYAKSSRIPGHEFSGTIAALGPSYTGPLKTGDDVYGMPAAGEGEAHADYALVLPNVIARKPRSISHAQAAALPIPLLTAWEAVHDYAAVQSGMRVLVTGAAGAVGQMVVQLLARQGATVIGLASAAKADSVRALGATEVVDYRQDGWEDSISKVDVAIDTVGSAVLSKCWHAITPSGTLVTIADPPPPWAFGGPPPAEAREKPGLKYHFFVLKPNGERLREAAELVDQGLLRPVGVRTVPFGEAVRAWNLAGERGREGKVVLEMVAGE